MKRNKYQLDLWAEVEQPVIYHQLIEVGYQGGKRETYCTANTYRPESKGQIYAGYVGFPVLPGDCTLCNETED